MLEKNDDTASPGSFQDSGVRAGILETGAGDGDRTRDVQLGKLHIDCKYNNLAFTARIFDTCKFLSFHRLGPALS
jgi:hypothetical protein